ncbi:AAA family ATPase [Calothrix sp. PCC 6303]|uniref:AAA family ATPase n=1 Tax=Calothrix sp. PCC 6303 TaxID=1170562 RepID=UPI0002A0154F|nr:AAA family ATPase [Calothrix sp. PCC 6303]AFZ03653.1 hypothetical protein Cal6303_4754 [Calothrix sp. PCC 6303]
MTTPIDYTKIYTHAPEQHPNLILGSLQLLFWMFFRPTAWRNHLKRIDPILDSNTSLIGILRSNRNILKKAALWKFLFQGFVLLPVLLTIVTRLAVTLILIAFGMSPELVIDFVTVCVAVGVAYGMVVGVVGGVAEGVVGVAYGMVGGVAVGVAYGVVGGVAFGVVVGVAYGMAVGVVIGVVIGVVVGVAFGMAEGGAFGVAYGMAEGVAVGMAVGVGLTIHSWRPFIFHPLLITWNFWLYRLQQGLTYKKPSLLSLYPAFWDEWSYIPFPELDKHLLLVINRNPEEGKAAIKYLAVTRQRWAVQAVQIELDAQMLEGCQNVNNIAEVAPRLEIEASESPVNSILRIFKRISKDIQSGLKQNSNYNQRLVLKSVTDRLEAQIPELTRSDNKYAPRFYPIAQSWREIISKYITELAQQTELRQEIDSPYILAVPLTQEQEIFAGRDDIGTRIEQLILDRRRPPLLLYGQRRMGKTSLLNNLGKLLPSSIIPLFVDLQGAPSSASDYTGFLYNLARGMITSAKKKAVNLPPLTRETLRDDPFTQFDEWLDEVETALAENTALLMLDEFEVLDSAISRGRFDEQDVLGMLRHLIQHRPKFKLMLAGSHTIEEYQRWASYLINVQVVHISYLKENEARQLIERPVKDFTLRYEPNAVERVLQITRCHPFLVQLICAEIVAYKNEQDPSVRRLATLSDVEAAIPEALGTGAFFFADIQNNQIDTIQREILKLIATQGEGAIVSQQTIEQHFPQVWQSTVRLLMQRELIEEASGGYRFQVELIRRWFRVKT